MQRDSKAAAAAAIERFFETPSNYAHADNVAALVLERLPSGEHAWLRCEADTHPAEHDDALYVLTEAGHDLVARWRAEEALFGRPWPTVAETT